MEENVNYFDKYTHNSACLRYGLGRRTHGGTRDAAGIYTSGAEGATRQHHLLIRSQEKKIQVGENKARRMLWVSWRGRFVCFGF